MPRLRAFDYRTPGAYFITVCVKNRAPLLGEVRECRVVLTAVGVIVEQHLQALPERHHGLTVDTYVIMPDHLHAILWLPTGGRMALSQLVASFKAGCSRSTRALGLWQRSFFDRVIRNQKELEALRRYVLENPLRWSLRAG